MNQDIWNGLEVLHAATREQKGKETVQMLVKESHRRMHVSRKSSDTVLSVTLMCGLKINHKECLNLFSLFIQAL